MVEPRQNWVHQARLVVFEHYRRTGVHVWVAATGISMRPLVRRDTWMLVEFGAATATIGDIVVFPHGSRLLAHRVVAHRWQHGEIRLMVKGDAEAYADPWISPAHILGVVRALRSGTAGAAQTIGCTGLSAHLIAAFSYLSGRGAWLLRHTAACFPGPSRQLVLNAIPPFTRVAAYTLLLPFLGAVWFQSQYRRMEGGEQHDAI